MEAKYSISSAIFSLQFSYLLFTGIFSQILMWWTVALLTPAILQLHKFSRQRFHHNQQNAWLCLLNCSERFSQPCTLSLVPYVKLAAFLLLRQRCSMVELSCLFYRERKQGADTSSSWHLKQSLVPCRTELKGSRMKPLFFQVRSWMNTQLPTINCGVINYSGEKSIHFWVSGMIFTCEKRC